LKIEDVIYGYRKSLEQGAPSTVFVFKNTAEYISDE